MDKAELRMLLVEMSKAPELPSCDDNELRGSLEAALLEHWDDIPELPRAMMIGVAAMLTRRVVDQMASDIRADMAVSKARGVRPKVILVDHDFIVDVSHEDGMWLAVCDAIGLVTEAETYEALTERALLILPELARENGVVKNGETAQVIFQQCQPSAAH